MSPRLAFVIDLKRCIGCDTCVVGCKVEHGVEAGRFRLKVLDSNNDPMLERPRGSYPSLSQYWVPTMCHHCADAPCVKVCPANSLRTRSDGIVILDEEKCIGCYRCAEACPYDALTFDEHTGLADKCDMCEGRLADNQRPSCQLVCPTRAIHHGDVSDPGSTVARLLAERQHQVLSESSGAKPQIYYLEP